MGRFSFSSKCIAAGLIALSSVLASGAIASEQAGGGDDLNALFLRGYAHHQQHEFDEALAVAGKLVDAREKPSDYGLLGDVHFDRGDLESAAAAYQRMVDLRPGIASYLRVAEMRWITGDLDGAIEAAVMAIRSGSQRQPETLAWAYCRLSRLILEKGDLASAHAAASQALELIPDYAPGLLARGLAFVAEERFESAVPVLRKAARKERDPKALWALWESHTELGRQEDADRVEKEVLFHGLGHDPRGAALFFSTLAKQPDVCTKVTRHELENRRDIFTHDAVAWSVFRANPESEKSLKLAQVHAEKAMSSGTTDPRVLLHAGLIAQGAGDREAAGSHFAGAHAARQVLMPSEKRLLDRAVAANSGSVSASR